MKNKTVWVKKSLKGRPQVKHDKPKFTTSVRTNREQQRQAEEAGITTQGIMDTFFELAELIGYDRYVKILKDRLTIAKFEALTKEEVDAANNIQ